MIQFHVNSVGNLHGFSHGFIPARSSPPSARLLRTRASAARLARSRGPALVEGPGAPRTKRPEARGRGSVSKSGFETQKGWVGFWLFLLLLVSLKLTKQKEPKKQKRRRKDTLGFEGVSLQNGLYDPCRVCVCVFLFDWSPL